MRDLQKENLLGVHAITVMPALFKELERFGVRITRALAADSKSELEAVKKEMAEMIENLARHLD